MKLDFAQLDELLTALRFAGLRMGVREVSRCRQVVKRWSEGGSEPAPERWRALLAIVLVRSKPECEIFDRVFASWMGTATLKDGAERPSREPGPSVDQQKRRLGSAHFGYWAGLALALVTWVFWPHLVTFFNLRPEPVAERIVASEPEPIAPAEGVVAPKPEPPAAPGGVVAPESELAPFSATGARDIPGASFTSPHLVILPRQQWPLSGWEIILLALCLSFWGAKVVFDLRRRSYLAKEIEKPREAGATRILLGANEASLPILVRAEQDALVWGVGRYLSEEATSRLDLPATVEAIAKAAGLPEIRFETARFQREVWLWLDEASEEKNLWQLADEVERALRREGLPCERAFFRGLPDVLFTADGRRFKPYDVEERRAAAIVLILSDGQLLGRRLQGHDRAPAEVVFRELGAWPRLGYFLPADAPGKVLDLARWHQIETQEPKELAGFLAAARLPRRPEGRDLPFWRAVCALGPASMAENTAAFLRSKLELEVSPWQLATLRAEAAASSGRLEWRPAQRRELVEWLRSAEEGGSTLYDRALDIWIEEIYGPAIQKTAADPALAGTVAERLLRAEQAMLVLLLRGSAAQPRRLEAIQTLDRIYEGTEMLRSWLRSKLALLDSADGSADCLGLEFVWAELAAVHQAALMRLGLGGRKAESRLLPPGRAVFLLAFLGGLVAGLGIKALWPVAEPWQVGKVENLLPAGWSVSEQIRGDGRQLQFDGEDIGPELSLATPARLELRSRPSGCRPQEKEDRWGFTLVRVCGGSFWIGTQDEDPGADQADTDEKPAHRVTLSEFWMDKYEVCAAQYLKLVPDKEGLQVSTLPVTDVDWTEASSFCAKRGGRLPTEAEWEYAARAGTRTPWSRGASEADLERLAWYKDNSGGSTHEVGTKAPNAWGLHDLHGNVWEWTATNWEDYTVEAKIDPPSSPSLLRPVVRGGSFLDEAWGLRSAYRIRGWPEGRSGGLGFRCVLVSRPVPGLLSSGPVSSPESDAQRAPTSGVGEVPPG